MKFVSSFCLALAALLLTAAVLAACGRQDDAQQTPNRSSPPADPAREAMRLATLRRVALANGFVRASELRIPVEQARREVGGLIFDSTIMSLNGDISCRDCHRDEFGSTDGLPNAFGAGAKGIGRERMHSGGEILPRNVLPFWGRGGKGFDTLFWDGRVRLDGARIISQFGDKPPSRDPLIVAAHLPSVEIREMVIDTPDIHERLVQEDVAGAHRLQAELARRFAGDRTIGPKLAAAYGVAPERLTFGEVVDALAAFIRDEFRIRPTKLERFVFDQGTISKDELAGGLLFYGRGRCSACHGGPYFSDLGFHAVAFPQAGFGKNGFGVDEGRYNATLDPKDRFLFRTPPLYNVSKTAPYSHSGSVVRLEDAIVAHFDPLRLVDTAKMSVRARADLYARMGPASREPLPSALSDEEVRQLVAFLRMLDFAQR